MNGRRHWLKLAALSPLLAAGRAFGGTYLARCALLIAQSARECEYLRARINDKDLAALVHGIAKARLDVASRMNVPKEVVNAHPHLLLMLENYERAAYSATEGLAEKFLIYQVRAREEEQVLRGVLKQLKYSLPDY